MLRSSSTPLERAGLAEESLGAMTVLTRPAEPRDLSPVISAVEFCHVVDNADTAAPIFEYSVFCSEDFGVVGENQLVRFFRYK